MHCNLEPSPAKLSWVTACLQDHAWEMNAYFCELVNLGSFYYTATLQQKLTNTLSTYSCLEKAVSLQDTGSRSKRNSPQRNCRFSQEKKEESKKWKRVNKDDRYMYLIKRKPIISFSWINKCLLKSCNYHVRLLCVSLGLGLTYLEIMCASVSFSPAWIAKEILYLGGNITSTCCWQEPVGNSSCINLLKCCSQIFH